MREKGQVYPHHHQHHHPQQQLHPFSHPHNRQAPPLPPPPPPHLHQHHATLAHHMRNYMNMPDLLAMGIQGEILKALEPSDGHAAICKLEAL